MKDSRFAYRERPNLSPGSCAACKGHGPVIDYRVNVPILGRLYICVACIEAGVSNIPLSAEEEVEVDKQRHIDELTVEVEDLNGTLSSLHRILSDWRSHADTTGDHVDSTADRNESKPAGKDSVPARKKSKSASKQDANGIPGDSNNVDDLFL